jgi:hypothetical protein
LISTAAKDASGVRAFLPRPEGRGRKAHRVKTHRKHLYAKLDIAKQSELFSLFIDSVAQAQEGLSKDPLESYLRRRR